MTDRDSRGTPIVRAPGLNHHRFAATKHGRRTAAGVVLGCFLVVALSSVVTHANGPQTFSVVTYGADNTGARDSTLAVAAAIAAAQGAGAGNIVDFPYGTYMFSKQVSQPTSIIVSGSVPVVMQGELSSTGAPPILMESVGKNLMNVQVDGTVVNQLELDTQPNSQSSSQQSALIMAASNTLLEHSTILGGSNTYALYYPGPSGASRTNIIYDTGNTIDGLTVSDAWNRDGVSFSFQSGGLIKNMNHTGSRLALFVDRNVEVDNETYHPGTQTVSQQGFWITAPSSNITINNFTTYGNGGTLGSGGAASTNVQINNEVFMNPGFHLTVGEVDGLTINGCNMGTNSDLRFITEHSASNVVVENCTSLPVVRFAQPTSNPGMVQAEFDGDTYPAFTPIPQEGSQTFANNFGGPTDFTVNNGTYGACSGGFFHGTNTTFAVNSLAGYPCTPDSPPNAVLTVTPNSGNAPVTVQADASGSTPGGSQPIVDYQFDWGDGTATTRQTSASLSHAYNAAGTFTITVDVIEKDGLNATDSATVTVTIVNLVGNPGFEGTTQGWKAGPATTLSLTTTAHSGSDSAQLTRTSTSGRAMLKDSPAWNGNTTAGTTCSIAAWVQAPSSRVYLRALEMNGTTTVSTTTATVRTVPGSWVLLSGQAAIINGGDALDIEIYAPLTVGQRLLVDDVGESCN